MRAAISSIVAVLLFASPVPSAAASADPTPSTLAADQASAARKGDEGEAPLGKMPPGLVGTWTSEPDEMRLTTAFDESVWGKDAKSVRTVELAVRPSGDATLTVTRKVVDAKGATVPASTSIEEAHFLIGAPHPGVGGRIEHEIRVQKAERKYPDDPDSTWTLDGVGIKVVTFEGGDENMLEVRFDTPEGRGSFWETLRRTRSGTNARGAKTE